MSKAKATQKAVETLTEGLANANIEIARLKSEVLEARNEATTVRRAYLHEKQRAEKALRVLNQHGYGSEAAALQRMAYRGPADRICEKDGKKFVIVSGEEDWQGLYVDGVLFTEDHTLHLDSLAKALDIHIDRITCSEEWLNDLGCLPKNLSDVKKVSP